MVTTATDIHRKSKKNKQVNLQTGRQNCCHVTQQQAVNARPADRMTDGHAYGQKWLCEFKGLLSVHAMTDNIHTVGEKCIKFES